MRVGLDGVVDLGVGQGPGEGAVVVAHDVEVEHQAGPFLFAVLKELADAIGHCSSIPSGQSANGCEHSGTARYAAVTRTIAAVCCHGLDLSLIHISEPTRLGMI